jgi:hypothetical protein
MQVPTSAGLEETCVYPDFRKQKIIYSKPQQSVYTYISINIFTHCIDALLHGMKHDSHPL